MRGDGRCRGRRRAPEVVHAKMLNKAAPHSYTSLCAGADCDVGQCASRLQPHLQVRLVVGRRQSVPERVQTCWRRQLRHLLSCALIWLVESRRVAGCRMADGSAQRAAQAGSGATDSSAHRRHGATECVPSTHRVCMKCVPVRSPAFVSPRSCACVVAVARVGT